MRAPAKVGLVVGGYVLAVAVAAGAVASYVASTSGPDRPTYAAMYAFGDSLLFLAVFGVAAALPTGATLFFLRPYRSFWLVLSIVALATAATGLAAAVGLFVQPSTEACSILRFLDSVAVLRVFVAPLFALAFFLAGRET